MNASCRLEMTVLLSRVVADRLWPLASFRNQPRSNFCTSALLPKADIQVISVKGLLVTQSGRFKKDNQCHRTGLLGRYQ